MGSELTGAPQPLNPSGVDEPQVHQIYLCTNMGTEFVKAGILADL